MISRSRRSETLAGDDHTPRLCSGIAFPRPVRTTSKRGARVRDGLVHGPEKHPAEDGPMEILRARSLIDSVPPGSIR